MALNNIILWNSITDRTTGLDQGLEKRSPGPQPLPLEPVDNSYNEKLWRVISEIKKGLLVRAAREAEHENPSLNLGPHYRHCHLNHLTFKGQSAYTGSLAATSILIKLLDVVAPLGFTRSRQLCLGVLWALQDIKNIREWKKSGEITMEMQHILVGDWLKERAIPKFFSEFILQVRECVDRIPSSERPEIAHAILGAFRLALGLDQKLGGECADEGLKLERAETWPPTAKMLNRLQKGHILRFGQPKSDSRSSSTESAIMSGAIDNSGASRHADQHEKPGVDVQESRPTLPKMLPESRNQPKQSSTSTNA